MTYYNNNAFGRAFSHMPLNDRNNMFLTAGYELGGTLQWSQPELALYDHRRDHGRCQPMHTGSTCRICPEYALAREAAPPPVYQCPLDMQPHPLVCVCVR